MDAWSPDQLKKMHLGGNDVVNNFLKQYGIDKYTDIKEKYNSQAAEVSARGPAGSCACHWGLIRSVCKGLVYCRLSKQHKRDQLDPCTGSGAWMSRVQVSSAQHTSCRGEQRESLPNACLLSRAGCRSSAHCKPSSCTGELKGDMLDGCACRCRFSVLKQTFQTPEGSCLLLHKSPQLPC